MTHAHAEPRRRERVAELVQRLCEGERHQIAREPFETERIAERVDERVPLPRGQHETTRSAPHHQPAEPRREHEGDPGQRSAQERLGMHERDAEEQVVMQEPAERPFAAGTRHATEPGDAVGIRHAHELMVLQEDG